MFTSINRLIVLSTLSFLVSACAPGFGLYQKHLAEQQIAYQKALAEQRAVVNGSSTVQTLPTPSVSQAKLAAPTEQDLKKTELQRQVKLQQEQELLIQIREGKREIPAELARKLLVGTFKGSTCDEKINIEISITEAYQNQPLWFRVNGSFRSYARSDQTNAPAVETPVTGGFYLRGGFLGLKSSSKPPPPPTSAQINEENRLREKARSEYKALENEFQTEIRKVYQNARLMSPEQRARALQEFTGKENLIRQRAENAAFQEKRRLEAKASPPAPIPPTIALKMDIARDADGRGWVGVIEGDGFGACHEVVFASDTGVTTSELPPITSELAIQRAQPKNYTTPSASTQLYWLNVAAKQGNANALYFLGKFYEERGRSAPQNYQSALKYYRDVVNKGDDARAQSALGRMYAEGLGTPTNLAEAKRWRNLADKTNSAAAKVCASPKTIDAIYQILKSAKQKEQFMAIGVALLTGIHFDSGNIKLNKVETDEVISLDKAFFCKVEGKRINPRGDASSVPDAYELTDQYGNRSVTSNAFDKTTKSAIASVAENLAKDLPYRDTFRMEPQGNHQYILTSNDPTRKDSVTLDLR